MARRCIRHILCPIDFSVESDTAIDCTEFLAAKLGARVTVIHAERFEVPFEFTSAQTGGLVAEMKKLKKDATHHLRQYVESRCPSLAADYKVVAKSPIEAILTEMVAQDIDLVVMGTTGKSGMKRFTMGSVAESVTREAKVPVLTIRDKSWAFVSAPKLERILVPISYSQPDVNALETAECFAQVIGANLLATHVVESDNYDENAATEHLRQWVSGQALEKCDCESVVRQGNAAEQIVKLAADAQVDMIVITAVHKPFLETTIIGATCERVMRHALCPVLVVPALD